MPKGTPGRVECAMPDCERQSQARGLCKYHHVRWRRGQIADMPPPETICSVEGCERFVQARGWCDAHYLRWQRHGAVDGQIGDLFLMADRFWAKVNKDGPIPEFAPHLGQCWDWTSNTVPNGYGQFGVRQSMRLAHRVAYELMIGEVPEGLELDHLCRRRICVRPSHLEAVTHLENMIRGMSPWAVARRNGTCLNGHDRTPENTYVYQGKTREYVCCRICRRLAKARYRARQSVTDEV